MWPWRPPARSPSGWPRGPRGRVDRGDRRRCCRGISCQIRERFEYTIIGEPVNEAARLCELAKTAPGRLIASADAVRGASEAEQAHWTFGNRVRLRGLEDPTQLATLVQ